jgi:hypothetical protein
METETQGGQKMKRTELIQTLKAAGIACDRAEDYICDGATELDTTGVCVYLDDPDNETVNFYLYPTEDGGWRTVDGIWACSGDVLDDDGVVGYVQKQQMEYNSNFPDWDPVVRK